MRKGDILILKNKAFLDGVCLPEIFTSEPNLCLNVYYGNLGDMLTKKTSRIKYYEFVFRNF